MNTELVVVTPAVLGGTEVLTVNARDLHAFLEVGKDFSTWLKSRIEEYGFTQDQDFAIDSPKLGNQTGRGGNRRQRDYLLTLDMAKELAMVERTDKGRQVRRYFIECESRLQRVAPAEAAAAAQAARAPSTLTADQQTAIKELVHSRVDVLPQDKRAAAAIKCWSALKSAFGCTYKAIPAARFTEAVSLVARLPLEGEWLGREAPSVKVVVRRRETSSELTAALERLLLDARAGRVTGVAAVAFRSDNAFDTVLSHAVAWDPLRAIGGIDRLRRDAHRQADEAGW